MITSESKLPNDKGVLMAVGNYEVYNRDLMRKVFPRIIRDVKELPAVRSRKVGDIIPFYFTLLSYIDGNECRTDGSHNERFGACFLSREAIAEHTGIDDKRQPFLCAILEENGLLQTQTHYEGTKRYKWYFPSFCPRITDDGYVVNSDGERVMPDYSRLPNVR